MSKKLFLVFAVLQNLSLAAIIFLIFRAFNILSGERVLHYDTQVLLSVAFPLFLLIVEYSIFTKK